jgi:SET domain-containing protein
MPTTSSVRVRMQLTQPWFEIRRSPIQGRGAFAVRAIPKGTRLIEYTGERIGHARFDVRHAREAKARRHHTFLFMATRRTVVDSRVQGNEAKYINHSCDPNCRSVIEKGRIYIETRKAVRKGQELAFDYSYRRNGTETAADEARFRCHCGAKKCRGSMLRPITEVRPERSSVKSRKVVSRDTASARKTTRR